MKPHLSIKQIKQMFNIKDGILAREFIKSCENMEEIIKNMSELKRNQPQLFAERTAPTAV